MSVKHAQETHVVDNRGREEANHGPAAPPARVEELCRQLGQTQERGALVQLLEETGRELGHAPVVVTGRRPEVVPLAVQEALEQAQIAIGPGPGAGGAEILDHRVDPARPVLRLEAGEIAVRLLQPQRGSAEERTSRALRNQPVHHRGDERMDADGGCGLPSSDQGQLTKEAQGPRQAEGGRGLAVREARQHAEPARRDDAGLGQVRRDLQEETRRRVAQRAPLAPQRDADGVLMPGREIARIDPRAVDGRELARAEGSQITGVRHLGNFLRWLAISARASGK